MNVVSGIRPGRTCQHTLLAFYSTLHLDSWERMKFNNVLERVCGRLPKLARVLYKTHPRRARRYEPNIMVSKPLYTSKKDVLTKRTHPGLTCHFKFDISLC